MWSQSSSEWCISLAVQHRDNGTVMLLPVGPIDHGTPKQDGVVTVLPLHSRIGARNRQSERAIHPLAQAEGLSGPFL